MKPNLAVQIGWSRTHEKSMPLCMRWVPKIGWVRIPNPEAIFPSMGMMKPCPDSFVRSGAERLSSSAIRLSMRMAIRYCSRSQRATSASWA